MAWDLETDNQTTNDVLTKRNWPIHIMMCQKFDKDGYGTAFPPIPSFNRSAVDTKLVWTISALLMSIKKLWLLTDECTIKQLQWHGWMISYLAKTSFKYISCRTDKKNSFKSIRTNTDIAKKLDRDIDHARKLCDIRELFNDHNSVLFINNLNDLETGVDNDNEVLIITPDYEVDRDLEQTIRIKNSTFKLRMILCTTDISETKWDGVVYSCHGGPNHQS